MDLTARVSALEEEVSILKGEIKTILQEVRIAVLARDNPFATVALDLAATPQAAPLGLVPVSPPAAESAANGHHVAVIPEPSVPVVPEPAAPQPPVRPVANPAPEVLTQISRESSSPQRWSVHSLAALMSWTQESAQRFSAQDLGIVLSLARYGGLIEKDLEDTLATLAEGLAPAEKPHRATGPDFLLALRQLDALLDEAVHPHQIEQPARRAS